MSTPMPGDDKAAPRATSRVVTPNSLTPAERARMFEVMGGHFLHLDEAQFQRDLGEKDSAIIVEDRDGAIQGFTTLKVLRQSVDGVTHSALYSGDTVLTPEFFGENNWITTWARHCRQLVLAFPDEKWYWLLLTATDRTYRFLPAFFKTFYPHPDFHPSTECLARLDAFVQKKFPEEYDLSRRVVVMTRPTPYRDPERVMEAVREDNRYTKFFKERNPGYLQSEFLACFAEFHPSNMTPRGRKIFER